MDDDTTQKVRNTLKQWITMDDRIRELQNEIKKIRDEKTKLSGVVLEFMRDNHIDDLALEGSGLGNIRRSVRTSRPPLRRNYIRTQLLLQFADQPQRVAEVLRSIEGIPEGADDMSVGGTQRELLVRHIPRSKTTMSIST
jgi:hypothetical protein